MMDLLTFANLIVIFVLNVLFFFSGICLNSLVILSLWKSALFRKKSCYFMIMVLSCCDLLSVLTNHPSKALTAMLWLSDTSKEYPSWLDIPLSLSNTFLAFSMLALLVMNLERYLATCYPIFHRTSVTKGRLLIIFAVLSIMFLTLALLSVYNFVISYTVFLLICFIILFPLMIFINHKLFTIARKYGRNNIITPAPGVKRTFSWKKISSCILAVVCFAVLSIPVCVYFGLRIHSIYSSKELTICNFQAKLARLWSTTIFSMNSTFNCLIFFWKNKLLRNEGMKIIKGFKVSRRDQS